MHRRTFAAFVMAVSAAILAVSLWPRHSDSQAAAAAEQASENEIAALRAKGRPALEQLLTQRDKLVAAPLPQDAQLAQRRNAQLAKLDSLIDAVGGQRHCSRSRLFWHTDMASAVFEARQTGKPILSLRMLGKLTDEYSCANSRFFRSTLYANADVSKLLRERFVLHWKSVRPVPIVTIDFGDGRKLQRTITGNSAHLVLASDGRPVDVIPGLYGPAKFISLLESAEKLTKEFEKTPPESRETFLADRHRLLADRIMAAWNDDVRAIRGEALQHNTVRGPDGNPTPDLDVAYAKGVIERPIAEGIELAKLEATTDDALWTAIAARHADEALLDEASIELIRSQNPTAAQAGRLARSKAIVEDPLIAVLRNLQSSIALDTVRNEYRLHLAIHEWFARREAPADTDQLNERVYAELFLTPSSDPWLGLEPPDTYAALDNNGVIDDGVVRVTPRD